MGVMAPPSPVVSGGPGGVLSILDNGSMSRGWRKSTKSNYGSCVEVAFDEGLVHVRNSRDPRGAALTFTAGEWEAFLAGAGEHEFDLPEPSEPRE